MPGSTPATSQLDWLSSTTAMIVLSWSKATRDLLKSFSWGIGALRQLFASDDGAISSPPAPYHLSAGGRRIAILVCVTCRRRKRASAPLARAMICVLFLAIFSATPRIDQSSPKKLVRARDRGQADCKGVQGYDRDHHHAGRICNHRSTPRSIWCDPSRRCCDCGRQDQGNGTVRRNRAQISRYRRHRRRHAVADAGASGRSQPWTRPFADPERCAQRLSGERSFRLGVHAHPATRANRRYLCPASPPQWLHAAAP